MMKKEKIKLLCKMCQHSLYKNGATVDVTSGGIMLAGGIRKIGAGDHDNSHNKGSAFFSNAASKNPDEANASVN